MYSDTIFEALELLKRDLKPDYAYDTIYARESVIKMMTEMRYLMFCSDQNLEHKPEAEKIRFYALAHDEMVSEYDRRMNDGYASNSD